jgi:hypothetical protein
VFRIVLASEAVSILREQFAPQSMLFGGAFCFVGLFVLMVQLQRQRVIDWRRLVAIVLSTLALVVLLFASSEFALAVGVVLAGGATVALGGVAVKIVVHLVKIV